LSDVLTRLREPKPPAAERLPAEEQDGILEMDAFAAATDRALAHGEDRAIVLIDFRSAWEDMAVAERWEALLVAVEARTSRTIRPGDLLGRVEGDRLAVLTEPAGGRPAAERVAARLAERLGEPYHVGGRELDLRPRIGVGYRVGAGDTAAAIIRRAEELAR
jgi:GGDEF domain-containing protein